MTLNEARKILGLGPEEDPRPLLGEFRSVREKIAEMVRAAPNDELAVRYQEGLVEFDQAITVVREHLEALGLVERVEDVKLVSGGGVVFVAENEVAEGVALPAVSMEARGGVAAAGVGEVADDAVEPGPRRLFRTVGVVLLLISLVGFGGWAFLTVRESNELRKQERVVYLERQGAIFIENRRWPEAAETFDEIESIYPGSELVMMGRRSIEAGMVEEQNQFIGYWRGEAIAAFEASRWDDAEVAAREVLAKYPEEVELRELMGKIEEAKGEEERQAAFDGVREMIRRGEFDEAVAVAEELAGRVPGDEQAVELLSGARAAQVQGRADLERARMLLAKAVERDKGEFDEGALEWMREAVALAPGDAEILARYEKMAAYTRTIRVPGDFATMGEALEAARDNDRIVLGEGVWEGPFFLNVGAKIEGLSGKTVMRCEANEGSVLTIGEGVFGARLSGVTLMHESFDAGEERFSLVMMRGGEVDFSDCAFERGSGHGLAVTGGGKARVLRCRFRENGWNGVAVTGVGSFLEAEESLFKENFQNGVESWDGGGLVLRKNQFVGNSRNGVHADGGGASVDVEGNVLSENREFGMVISGGGKGEVKGNRVEKNILGGVVVKAAAAGVRFSGNEIRANEGCGLVLEKGLSGEAYAENRVSGNGNGNGNVSGIVNGSGGKDVVVDADFTVE